MTINKETKMRLGLRRRFKYGILTHYSSFDFLYLYAMKFVFQSLLKDEPPWPLSGQQTGRRPISKLIATGISWHRPPTKRLFAFPLEGFETP